MEARSATSEGNGELEGRVKSEIEEGATATASASASSPSPSELPPLEESEPPPLEEQSEPYSKGNSPPIISSPLSEDLERGHSPPYVAHINRFEGGGIQTDSGFLPNDASPPHVGSLEGEDVQPKSAFVQNEAPPPHTNRNTASIKTSVGSTLSNEKGEVKPSVWSRIPAITNSVKAAAKNISFRTQSLSSRSSAIYGSSPWWTGTSPHQMKIVEVVLRFCGAVLALISFSVMVATSEVRSGAGSTFKMKFTDYQAYNYLVALNLISFLYSCWQLVLLGKSNLTSGILSTTHGNMLLNYVCDQVLAFLLFSASTAAATAAELSRHGLQNIWPPACSTWNLWLFCSRADAAVVMSFFTSFFVIASSVFSSYHLSHSLTA